MEGFRPDRLRQIRIQAGLAQSDIEGVSQDTVSAIETGHRAPRPSTLKRLSKALSCEVSDFFQEPIVAPLAAARR